MDSSCQATVQDRNHSHIQIPHNTSMLVTSKFASRCYYKLRISLRAARNSGLFAKKRCNNSTCKHDNSSWSNIVCLHHAATNCPGLQLY